MKYSITVLLICLTISFSVSDTAGQTTTYRVTIPDPHKKIVLVEAEFILKDSVLYMTPNGPMPGRWPQYVQDLRLRDQQGNLLSVTPQGDHWVTEADMNQPVGLSYKVTLTHPEKDWPGGIDGVAFSRDWGFFLTGRSLFVMNGDERSDIQVQVEVPEDWKISVPWEKIASKPNRYQLNSYRELTESLMMAGSHKRLTVARDMLSLQFILGGKGVIQQEERIKGLAQQTMDYYIDLMTGVPVPPKQGSSKILVIINEADQVDGEVIGRHISMLMDPEAPPQQQLVGWFMFAHEFFHLWNGKTISVHSTREDWFKEGITNYYTLKALYQVGFINEQALAGVLNGLFYQRYRADSGLGSLSMRDAASGFDKDNHWGLIYGGGLFAGIAMDMMIRENTGNDKSLDDLMRHLYRTFGDNDKTYTTDDILSAANELSGADLSSFFETYINGTSPIPIEDYLSKAGYAVTVKEGQLLIKPLTEMTSMEREIHKGFLGN